MAKIRLISVVLCQTYFAEKSVGNVKHCTNSWGYQKGDRNPTFVVAGEGSQGEGESKHPLPVRLFGDFLFAQKVTLRSNRQSVAANTPHSNRGIASSTAHGVTSSQLLQKGLSRAPAHRCLKSASPSSIIRTGGCLHILFTLPEPPRRLQRNN